MSSPEVVFVLGGPGVGKGTQCAKLVAEHNYTHLSAGDLLRAERNAGGENADLINSFIIAGKIVPVEITVNLIKNAMRENGWNKKYLIDGFPRNAENYRGWCEVMKDEKINLKKCIFFQADEETMIARIMERSKTSGRKDDNMESLIARLKTFNTESVPIVQMFDRTRPGFVAYIDALQSIEEVFSDVEETLKLHDKSCTAEHRPFLFAWDQAVRKHHAWFEIQKIQQRQQLDNLKSSRWTNWRDPIQWASRYQAIDSLELRQQLGSISKSELSEVQGQSGNTRLYLNREPAGISSYQMLPLAAAAAVGLGTGAYQKLVRGQNILWVGAAFLPIVLTGTVLLNRQDEVAKQNAFRYLIAKRAATAEHERQKMYCFRYQKSEHYNTLSAAMKTNNSTLYDTEQNLINRIQNGTF